MVKPQVEIFIWVASAPLTDFNVKILSGHNYRQKWIPKLKNIYISSRGL